MRANISRRRLAAVVVDRLKSYPKARVLEELAAYLVEEGLTRQIDLIMRDIEAEYAKRGHTVADVTSAHVLDDASRRELAQFVAAATNTQHVELREAINAELIGGVIIGTPGKYFDGSLRGRLQQLRVNSR